MLLPKFTLAQGFWLTFLVSCLSFVLAAAAQEQAWARGLTLAAGLAVPVAAVTAAAYWFCLALGRVLVRRAANKPAADAVER